MPLLATSNTYIKSLLALSRLFLCFFLAIWKTFIRLWHIAPNCQGFFMFFLPSGKPLSAFGISRQTVKAFLCFFCRLENLYQAFGISRQTVKAFLCFFCRLENLYQPLAYRAKLQGFFMFFLPPVEHQSAAFKLFEPLCQLFFKNPQKKLTWFFRDVMFSA